jgi:cytoskeletal protein RodZ
MATVAEQLRHAREEQKLSIYQVAEITKIKTDHIRALESGNFDSFSAPVYIRGFVRTYARALKLDDARMVGDLETELGQNEKFRAPPPLTNEPRGTLDFVMLQLSKLNWRILVSVLVVAFVVIVLVGSFRGSRNTKQNDPLKKLGPGLYQPSPNESGELLPLPTNNAPRRP